MKIKSIVAVIVLAALMLTSACQTAELIPFIDPNETDDLGGVEFEVFFQGAGRTRPTYKIDTPQYDALMAHIDNVEQKLNCTIDLLYPDGNPDDERPSPNVDVEALAGTLTQDVLLIGRNADSFRSGLFLPMTYFPDIIDVYDSEKYGSLGLLEAGAWEGVPYSVSPVQWPGWEAIEIGLCAYNRDMFEENGVTDLQEYYEQEIWTYDTFENEFLAKTDLPNAATDITYYLLQTDEPDLYQCLIYSNDVQFVKENADGSLSPDPYPQSFINAIEWSQGIFARFDGKILGDSDSYSPEEYLKEQTYTLFSPCATTVTGAIAYNEYSDFDSGIMPLPCGPDAEYGKWGQCVQNMHGFVIPITADNPEASAKIIAELCAPLEGYENKEDFYYQVFSRELDIEIYLQLDKNVRYDYTNVGTNKLGRTIGERFGEIAVNPDKSLSEAMDGNRNTMIMFIEDYVIDNYEFVHSMDDK